MYRIAVLRRTGDVPASTDHHPAAPAAERGRNPSVERRGRRENCTGLRLPSVSPVEGLTEVDAVSIDEDQRLRLSYTKGAQASLRPPEKQVNRRASCALFFPLQSKPSAQSFTVFVATVRQKWASCSTKSRVGRQASSSFPAVCGRARLYSWSCPSHTQGYKVLLYWRREALSFWPAPKPPRQCNYSARKAELVANEF